MGYLQKELAQAWTTKRAEEASNRKVITYCAGCTHFLGQQMDASHLLDFLYEPQKSHGTNRENCIFSLYLFASPPT